jgi:hypothetical protein
MIVPGRYNGPPTSANGGYASGLLAGLLEGEAEVTLRRPPPLDRELEVVETDGGVELYDGETLVAEARPGAGVPLAAPAVVSLEEATEARSRYPGLVHHAYPTCFTCGPERDDGLAVYPGPVERRQGLVASTWTPDGDVRPEIVWAALDCPGGWAVDDFQREGVLLGRIEAQVGRLPTAGEPHVVVGWPLGEDGRKRHAGSALLTASGEVLAASRSTWIVPGGRSLPPPTERGRAPEA